MEFLIQIASPLGLVTLSDLPVGTRRRELGASWFLEIVQLQDLRFPTFRAIAPISREDGCCVPYGVWSTEDSPCD